MTYETRGDIVREPESGSRERDSLPQDFLEWQRESRMALLRGFAAGPHKARTMPSHLPVLATLSEEGAINLATKGMGLIPKQTVIADFTSLFRSKAEEGKDRPPMETTAERLEALLKFYGDTTNFDDSKLGGLEIFEGTTYENLMQDRRASLLFSGEAPGFQSFQIDGEIEFVHPGNPCYDFLVAARELFSRDSFHVPQSSYPHGYVLHVNAVRVKTPTSRM